MDTSAITAAAQASSVELSLVRGRHARRARPARAPHARGDAVPRPPRPRPVHPPDRRHPQGRRVRPALQPRHAARRRVLLAHGRGPRAAAVRRRRQAARLPRAARCSSGWTPPPTSACRSSSPTARASARWRALSREYCAFEPADEQLFVMLARVLASELERESNERDLRRFNDMLRDQARGMGAVGRVAKALAAGEDARTRRLRGRLRGRGRAGRVPARAERPRVHLDRDGRRRHRPGDDPAARRPDRPGPRVHRQGDLLRRRRAHAPGARRAAGGGHRRPLGGVRAGAARRRRRRRADRDLARAAGGAARTRPAACCGCSPPRPRWRSSTPRCASGSPASPSPTR